MYTCSKLHIDTGADPEFFQRGGGGCLVGKFTKKKMFVDTRINTCTHKN